MSFQPKKEFAQGDLCVRTDIFRAIPIIESFGEADISNISAFKDALAYAVESGLKEIIVDLRRMDFMDSSGFNTLVQSARQLEETNGGKMVIICPRTHIEQCIRLLGIDALIPVFHTLSEAVSHFEKRAIRPPKAA